MEKTHILIIDEISMMSKKIFEILEELGRIIKKSFTFWRYPNYIYW